ncbi:hypothetical protein VNO78_20985 [Psophocarpus tetragonolobus]|uniref:Uncharacterized protein n=1 Tax=Psophocarpus tetragonolobus TaxID=3891 RepID=A0AAN9XH90_PSOTE
MIDETMVQKKCSRIRLGQIEESGCSLFGVLIKLVVIEGNEKCIFHLYTLCLLKHDLLIINFYFKLYIAFVD